MANYNFQMSYNTDEQDIVEEFYIPVLTDAVLYKRAAGFFSSSSLLIVSRGIEKLLDNSGKMLLVMSPILSKEDIDAISKAYDTRDKIIEQALEKSFDLDIFSEHESSNFLAWLIFEQKLDLKIVIRNDFSSVGMFHDKFGVICDKDGGKIAFRGSMNESETAFLDNYESIEVFMSSDDRDLLRIEKIEQDFDKIWSNRSYKWDTLTLPEAIKQKILSIKSSKRPSQSSYQGVSTRANSSEINLRNYQKDAIRAWLENDCQGILEMATGTGKTITAIAAMLKIIEQYQRVQNPFALIIVVPYKVLLEQWADVLSRYGLNPINCYENAVFWQQKLSDMIRLTNSGTCPFLPIITTNATFKNETFQSFLKKIRIDMMICLDEVHHCITKRAIESLPLSSKYRLGLTATLFNQYNSIGINNLEQFFGKGIIYRFSLKQAIDNGFLTPYYYYPIFVDLTDTEKSKYYELSHKLGQLIARGYDMEDNNIQNLLIKRARLIASAENKLIKLREMGSSFCNTNYNIFYCGDKIENDTRYVKRVNKLLAYDLNMKTHTFTAEESQSDRKRILQDFDQGQIQALTAIRCLDEGVDIPKLQSAFILSSGSNPKEFVQRRGRILRLSSGKEFANIYDFIVVPTLNRDEVQSLSNSEFKTEQKILLREFQRFKEFADLAINNHDAYSAIIKIWSLYD